MGRFASSDRLQRLPPYLFAEFERKRAALEKAGKDIINLGIGDPDQPPPRLLTDRLVEVMGEPGIHQYSSSQGTEDFRGAVCRWFKRRYNVALEPKEVCLGVGSKELIAHAPLALTNPGDVVLIPDPGYPPYRSGAVFALCEPFVMPLKKSNGFLPDLDAIPKDVADRAKILYVNYPNNPTGATATREFYAKCVAFARKHGTIVVSDEAYAELYYEEAPPSFLEVPGAKEVGVAVHSMTKTFSMAGWRVAWVAGNAEVVEILRGFKANCDSGQFMAFQKAVATVLDKGEGDMKAIREMYRKRRDSFVGGLRALGWEVPSPRAAFYVWFDVPEKGASSMEFADRVLDRAGVIMLPGVGFGAFAEGFMRVALTVTEDRLKEAVERLKKM
ncbi:MAG TPA: aminotransferase class I/II-fold pyridoxal phosphate-dependent enzyme [Planctomycetota bacterium]|nr:aminotransferase class I/II-fold pyridoxal phosphate-dependent enzyme [Planctomycetota bacterium]